MDIIAQILGKEADNLLNHECRTIPKDALHLPGPDFVDRIVAPSKPQSAGLTQHPGTFQPRPSGRQPATCPILPVDQGIEHSAGASFAPNPIYFDPENIVKLAIEGGCNAVASHRRRARGRIAQIRPQNSLHRQTQPQRIPQLPQHLRPAPVCKASSRSGNSAPSPSVPPSTLVRRNPTARSRKSLPPSNKLTNLAWSQFYGVTCAISAFKTKEQDYHTAADLTGQANHLGVTLQADLIKQKQPTCNGGYTALNFGKTHKLVYEKTHHRPPHRPDPLPGR